MIFFIVFTTTGVYGVMDKKQHVWELVFHDNIPSICMSTLTCIGVVMDAYMNVFDTLLTSRWMTLLDEYGHIHKEHVQKLLQNTHMLP